MKKILTYLFSLSVAGLIAQTCDGRYQTEIYSQVDVTTVDYGSAITRLGDTQILQMDIYQAVGDTATDRPVVIFCFGGTFIAGSRTSSELVTFATSLAKRGFVCASIDYRLAGSLFELISEENLIKVVFSAVQDGKAAIRYFRKDFEDGNALGISPDNIFIGGTSAGGILAANLAYVDDLSKLPNDWKEWAEEIGGIEGMSGNPGYCSYPNGAFGFAGAVGDTAYIDANDVPYYACHSTGDQTVKYGYGAPLENPLITIPVSLYGSGEMEKRFNNLGIYNVLDTYTGGSHPPLNTAQRMDDTRDNLGVFLYNLLDCNAANLKKSDQQSCDDFGNPTNILAVNAVKDWKIYPNPSDNYLSISGDSNFEELKIMDAMGRELIKFSVNETKQLTIDLQDFASGTYFVYVQTEGVWRSEKLILK